MSSQPEDTNHLAPHPRALPCNGVWAPPVTPINEDLSVDVNLWLSHLQWLLDNGCHGLAVFGTTSEANSFSTGERKALVEAAVTHGISPSALMVGTGCCSIPETIDLTQHALQAGCNKVLMLPPFYYKGVSDHGLYDHYCRVIDGVDNSKLEVYLYHFPKMSATPLSLDLIARLCETYPQTVVGIKDSSGDWNNTQLLLQNFPQIAVFPGSESLLLDGLRHGGAGCITATANANPTAIRAVYDSWCNEDGEADERQADIYATRGVFNGFAAVPALKTVLARRHGVTHWRNVRPPMVSMSDDDGDALMSELEKQGYKFPG